MAVTLQQAIDLARGVLNDRATSKRYSDADLLQYGNDAIDLIALARPEMFYETVEVTCIANSPVQKLAQADSLGLVDVLYVKGGSAVTKTDRATMDRVLPTWPSASAAAAENWMPLDDDPFRFLISPPAPAGQVLVAIHIKPPPEYLSTDTLPVAAAYLSLIADYIIGMAESRQDESINSDRAQAFITKFMTALGISNTENPAEKPK